MATIGLDKLYYAKITEGENGEETYEAPVQLAKANQLHLACELKRNHQVARSQHQSSLTS